MENNRALSRPLQYPQLSPLPSTYGVPMPLNLGCKLFISHSGCDKEFVRHLYVALCRRYQDKEVGFFDEESLPTAEAISMDNILEEARRSQLGVLVLTEDFFVKSPNPMRELEAFTSGEVRLLPLFFGMSVDEFKEKIKTRSWEMNHWRNWSTKELGGRSNVEEVVETWRHSLNLVTTFSGLERKKIANSDQEFIQKIVDKVTQIIPPTTLFSEKGVCGKIRLCQIINNMYEKCAAKHTSSIDRTPIGVASTSASSSFEEKNSGYTTLDLVGIYGFSGLGKTTLCKCLCDFYFAEFNGRVYYVDVGSSLVDHTSSQKPSVLTRLSTSNNNDFLHFSVIEQVKNLFSDEQFSSMKDPIFLAIDNILPDKKSQEEAQFYLSYKFPKGSKILITSKSANILRNLASLHSCSFFAVIEYMPALTHEEARDIFVHEFPDLHKHGFSNLEDDLMECVKMCTIHKWRYHPLIIKSLAAFVKWDNLDLNLDLKQRLKKLRLEGIKDKESALEKVYAMLDKPYALLNEDEKRVFLDLVLFYNATSYKNENDRWIKMLHSHLREEKMKKIILKLQHLCFLEETNYEYTCLDLVVGFGKHKAEQGDFPEYLVRDGACRLAGLRRSARTISISGYRGQHDDTASVRSLDLRAVEGVKVLHIVDNPGLQEVQLSNITCACLRSLIVRVPEGTSLLCTCERDWSSMSAHETGDQGLQWVELNGDVCFRPPSQLSEKRSRRSALSNAFCSSLRYLGITSARNAMDLVSVLGGLRNLEVLLLSRLPAVQSIDVTTCANLKELTLSWMPRLELISGLENSSLKIVDIRECDNVSVLTIPADLETCFFISRCRSLKRVSFRTESSYKNGAGAHSSRFGCFCLWSRSAVTELDGLSKYTGCFFSSRHSTQRRLWNVTTGPGNDVQKLFAGVETSKCKALITAFRANYPAAGLADVEMISLADAQHIGPFITALFKAQPENLQNLEIHCKEGGDCGCDQNAPLFGLLPMPRSNGYFNIQFTYRCSQVKALASLGQWHALTSLDLRGCTSVEIWPDFSAMTLLKKLDLSSTSLKEWPAGVQHLPHLKELGMRGCQQLPAEEIMKVVSFELQPATPGIAVCAIQSLAALKSDLRRQSRDRCSVANALDGVYIELVALFDRSSWSLLEAVVLQLVIAIMYDVLWPFNGDQADVAQELHIRTKLERLLCSERFLSLPFRACDRCFLLSHSRSWTSWPIYVYSARDLCNMRAGGEEESEMMKDHVMRAMALKGIALGGAGGCSLACLNATPVYDHLRDTITDYRRSLTQLQTQTCGCSFFEVGYEAMDSMYIDARRLEQEELSVLKRRVQEAVGRVAREVGSVAAEFGEVVVYTIMLAQQSLKADSSHY